VKSLSTITYLSVFIIIRLSGITSTVTRGLPSFRILKMFLTDDPTRSNPIQPNPWIDPTMDNSAPSGAVVSIRRFWRPLHMSNLFTYYD